MLQKNDNNKSLIFGITKLDIGGAERVLVDIANKLCVKYNITILTIYSGGELEKELNEKIKIINLYKNKNIMLPLYLLFFGNKKYKKIIKNKYDVEIAFLEGPITRIFSYGKNKNKIAWVHNDIKKVFGKGIKANIKKCIDKRFYKKYNKIIFVSQDNRKSFVELYGDFNKQYVIYNYIDKDRILIKSKEKNNILKRENVPVILSIARLVKQKGIDRLIRVHKKLIEDGIAHKIYVIGDGEEKKKLQKLIDDFDLKESFILLGKKSNPYCYLKNVDYFALLSYYEGYGIVIEEAKLFNKTIIITNTAAKEAVRDYNNCLIISNYENDIYVELKKLLQGKYNYIKSQNEYQYDNSYILEKIEEVIRDE